MPKDKKPKAILSFDVEFWYSGTFMEKYSPQDQNIKQCDDHSTQTIKKILDVLKENNQSATFFVLGEFAKRNPDAVKMIASANQEIASHGFTHTPIYKLNKAEFENDLRQANETLKNISGSLPKGYRAPNFSLSNDSKWACEVVNHHFSYSSCSHPLASITDKTMDMPATLGGFYFRALPLPIFGVLIKILKRTPLPILYFHPYELFDFTPRICWGPWLRRKIKYIGIKNAWKKFQRLQKKFQFISFEQYLNENPSN